MMWQYTVIYYIILYVLFNICLGAHKYVYEKYLTFIISMFQSTHK